MRLYEYLEENVGNEYEWEDYCFGNAEIEELQEESFLSETWDTITEWAAEYADDCNGSDATLIARILNETLIFIHTKTRTETVTVRDVAALCSAYAHCCVFAKQPFEGNELFEKCRFVVNNKIANSILSQKLTEVSLVDIEDSDPAEEEWEEF